MSFHKNLQPTTYNLQPSRGFTVMELLVVMAVMGILYTVVMSSVGDSRAKGRDSKRIADISLIQLALEGYYDRNHEYPIFLSTLEEETGYSFIPPKDPSLDGDYSYKSLNGNNMYTCSSKCQSYHLGATLEVNNKGVLEDDADQNLSGSITDDFSGRDDKGCDGASGYCYDVVPKF